MIWRHLLLGAALKLASQVLGAHVPNPAPAVEGRDTAGVSPWVSLQSDGSAKTITPSIVTTDGAVSTISAPPSYLTRTAAWTLTVGSQTTTSTGLSPTATATGPGQAGTFMLCNNYEGLHAPFCLPGDGSTLTSGNIYYVTWDPNYFGSGNTSIQVQGDFEGTEVGFASEVLPASRGFYSWNVTLDVLQTAKTNDGIPSVSLSIVMWDNNNASIGSSQQGPTVSLANSTSTNSSSSNIDVLAVALPSMLGITILIIACAIWVINRKRRGAPSLPSWLQALFKPRGGNSARQQYSARSAVVSPSINKRHYQSGIQLSGRDSWSATSLGREPHPGRNVFRDEMARQERIRR